MARGARARRRRGNEARRWRGGALAAVVVLLAACGDDDGPADAAPADSVVTLLDRVPEPGGPQPGGTVEYAGTTAGGPNLALLVDEDGTVVLYACDGASYGELFEGTIDATTTELELTGAAGGTARLDLSGPLPTGVLEAGEATHRFVLTSADDDTGSAGFYRRVDGDAVAAWVVAGDGSVRGVHKQGAEVTGGIDSALGEPDVVGEGFPPPPAEDAEPVLFKKRRCAKLGQDLAVLDRVAVNLFEDHREASDEVSEFMQPLREEFDRLGCSLDDIQIPDFGSPPPGSVGSLNR